MLHKIRKSANLSNIKPSDGQGGGMVDATPQQVFPVFLRYGMSLSLSAFLQTDFLAVGSSLEHLSNKKFFRAELLSLP